MRKLLLPILILVLMGAAFATAPYRTLTKTETTSALSAGGKDTITVTGVILSGDSTGFMIGFNRDSVSGEIRYQYSTPAGYVSKSFANADVLTTFDCNDGSQAVFTEAVPRSAGNYDCTIYIILTNDDISSSPRTITTSIYTINWR